MDCNNCQELFSDYLDRLMDDPQLHPFEKHLAECPECAEEWDCFAQAVSWVRQMQFTAPEGILQGIRQKIGGGQPSGPPNGNFLSRLYNFLRFHDFSLPLPTAAATLAVALLAMLVVKHFAAGNLPQFHAQQTAGENTIAQSAAVARPAAEPYHGQQPPAMYQRPEVSDASYADLDNFLPLQQLDTQFVTTGSPSPFASGNFLASSPHSKELNRQFYSMLTGHPLPDVRILVNNLPVTNRLQLSRQLLNNPAWAAQHFGSDTILLQMDPSKLKQLHGIFAGQNILIIPPDATDTAFGSPKKLVNVAVRLR